MSFSVSVILPLIKNQPQYTKPTNLPFLPFKTFYVESCFGTDIDECAENPDICGLGNICENTPGHYVCASVDCGLGYQKNAEGICTGKKTLLCLFQYFN